MSQLSPILRDAADNKLLFWCPGCDMAHGVNVGEGAGPRWGWNADIDKPAFTPSVLVQWRSLSPESRERNNAFHKEHGRFMTDQELPWDVNNVCHSFVGNSGALPGQIIFLNDSTHKLAGQTVDLPRWDWDNTP